MTKALIGIILALVAVILWLQYCQKPVSTINYQSKADTLKSEIKKGLVKKDSIHQKAVKEDSQRVVYVTKWREVKAEVKKDTAKSRPCDSIITKIVSICDTMVIKDSTEIMTLKAEIKQDSVLFVNYRELTKTDSLQIVSLKKEVRRQKRLKVLAWITAGIIGGVFIIK
jgi:hypothetical protein